MSTGTNYDDGFTDGLQAAGMLFQAGATPGDLLAAIGADGDPRECQDNLAALRRIMGTDVIARSAQ